MAEVFLARMFTEGEAERTVVLKQVLPQHARDAHFRRLFWEEALLVANLEHPNIVRMVDFGEYQGTFFLVLEYVDGADLDTILKRSIRTGKTLTPLLAAYIIKEISTALEYVHTRIDADGNPLCIVHRDVSPQNILISSSGEVKLADFGIARSVIRTIKTTDGTIKGKYDYMSPEQATASSKVDARSDIFALGTVFYQLLFQRSPFRGHSELDTLKNVQQCSFTLEDTWLPDRHRMLASILRQCLSQHPKDRFSSAQEVKVSLLGYLSSFSETIDQIQFAHWLRELEDSDSSGQTEHLVKDLLGKGYESGTAMLIVNPQHQEQSQAVNEVNLPSVVGEFRESDEINLSNLTPKAKWRAGTLIALILVVALMSSLITVFVVRKMAASSGKRAEATGRLSMKSGAKLNSPTHRAVEGQGKGNAAKLDTQAKQAASSSKTSHVETKNRAAFSDAQAASPAREISSALSLSVRSQPSHAEVFIDNQRVGQTPLDRAAPQEKFRIKLEKRGFHPWMKWVDAPTQDLLVEAKLVRKAKEIGRLTINSIPWAYVYIDGKLLGTTPIRSARIEAGTRRILLKDGQGKILRKFMARITSGRGVTFSFDRNTP